MHCILFTGMSSCQGTSLDMSIPPLIPSSLASPRSLHCSSTSPPSYLSLVPSLPRSVPSSLFPFLNHPSVYSLPPAHHRFLPPPLVPFLPHSTIPLRRPSHPPSFLAPSIPLPACLPPAGQLHVHRVYVCVFGELHLILCRALRCVTLRQWCTHSSSRRCLSGVPSANATPPRIHF